MKVVLDPGHGGRNQNIGLGGYRESDFALAVATAARDLLQATGVTVLLTREADVDLCPGKPWVEREDLAARCAIANAAGADLYASIHSNAVGGSGDASAAHGTETYCYQRGGKGEALATAIQRRLVAALGTADRGVKTANFYVLRNTTMPAALTEVAFHTHPGDVAILRDPAKQQLAARAIADGILEVLGSRAAAPMQPPTAGTPILGPAQATVERAQAWARSRGASQWFIDLAPIYWRLAPTRGGVRPEVAYAQAAKETRFGLFGGVIPGPQYHNPCGLKTAAGGSNDDPAAHMQFPDDETGGTGHLDHLALYAGAPGYPRADTPDPRHFPSIAGVAPTVEQLGGRWAPSADYGASIVREYLTPLLAMPVPDPAPSPPEEDDRAAELERLRAENAALAVENQKLKARLAEVADLARKEI